MAPERTDSSAVPTQQNLFEVEGDGNVLQPFLGIHPPDEASKAPPVLAFKRKREVEIPWGEIVPSEEDGRASAASIAAIRNYFEDSWDLELEEALGSDELLGGDPWRVKVISTGDPPFTVYRPDFDDLDPEGKPKPVPVPKGFVIRHGTSGRMYLLINPKQTLGVEHFRTLDMYKSAWEEQIDGVELVFESSEEAQSGYMDFEEIDLRPVVIQRKCKELCILRHFARTVKEKVEGVTGKMIDQITGTTLDADQLEQLQRKVLRLEIGEYDVDRRIQRLVSDAARLGYLLAIEDKPGDDTTDKLEESKLYTTYKRTARWTEYVLKRVPVQVGWWIFRRTKMKEVKIPRPMEKIVEVHEEVDTSKDILGEKRSEMLKGGNHVYVFEQTPSGMVSTEGVPLRQVMDRCKYDEDFRCLCVVMLPVYEESLTGQRMVAKYSIFKRPLPGLLPTILPRLSLEESLTYRTAWRETQLGELVSTINLAPDEERKVTVIKRFEQETTVARTSTSIFDISRAETTDLSTEMENQARQERESSKTLQFSTKASGGYGPFSAEASASGGTSSSLKDVSQAMSRVARKAAQSVSSQNREEVSSTTTARTTVSNTDETVATIRNINQGRSLNLLFYRLYNKYHGGLFLEGLRFDVIPSVEVIAGSGVHESRSYSLEELPRVIDEFKAAQLPFAIEDEEKYTDRLLDTIETLLRREYLERPGDVRLTAAAVKGPEPPEAGTSVARLSFPPAGALRSALQAARVDADPRLAELSENLRRATIQSDKPIAPQELLVAAPGLYLDAAVGAQPSTEPYSEQMRTQEVQMRKAEVAVQESEGAYKWAMAMRLAQMRPADGANCLTGVLPSIDRTSLTLLLRMPVPSGDWRLVVDGDKTDRVATTNLGGQLVAFSWDEPQDWLSDPDLLSRIGLLNEETSDTIVYPV